MISPNSRTVALQLHNPCKMTHLLLLLLLLLLLPGPGARRAESSRLRWLKDGDSAFLDRCRRKELDERSCPGRASRPGLRVTVRPGRPGGRDQSGGIWPAELGAGYWKLSEQSPSPDIDTHRALSWFCDILCCAS